MTAHSTTCTVHMFVAVCEEKEVWNADFMRRAIISESDFENGLLFGRRRFLSWTEPGDRSSAALRLLAAVLL